MHEPDTKMAGPGIFFNFIRNNGLNKNFFSDVGNHEGSGVWNGFAGSMIGLRRCTGIMNERDKRTSRA